MILVLYLLTLSHFFFDYGYMVTPEMVKAKSKGSPAKPIAKHAALHAFGVFLVLVFNFNYITLPIWLFVSLVFMEFFAHLVIDTWKGIIETNYPKLKDNTNPKCWHLFQIDQVLHLSCKFLYVYLISLYIC